MGSEHVFYRKFPALIVILSLMSLIYTLEAYSKVRTLPIDVFSFICIEFYSITLNKWIIDMAKMSKNDVAARILEVGTLHGHGLLRAMDWGFDYEKDIPKIQFPAPGPKPKSGARYMTFELDGTIDPASVTADSVLIRVDNQFVDVDFDISATNEISVRPSEGWKKPSLVDVILTPDIRTTGGRAFLGYIEHRPITVA